MGIGRACRLDVTPADERLRVLYIYRVRELNFLRCVILDTTYLSPDVTQYNLLVYSDKPELNLT